MDKMTKACILKTEFDDWLLKSTVFKEKTDEIGSLKDN